MPIPSSYSKRVKIYHESHNEVNYGSVYCTGTGDMGQLGLGEDILETKRARKVPNVPSSCIQVCAGGVHSACLTVDGKVFTWGCNDDGALGRVTESSDDTDQKVISEYEAGPVIGEIVNSKIVQISCGDSHMAALTDDGLVYIWGTFRNINGRIGLIKQNRTERFPVRLILKARERPTVIKIASGADHMCCLCSDGRLFIFGNWEQGQLSRNCLAEIREKEEAEKRQRDSADDDDDDDDDEYDGDEKDDSYFDLDDELAYEEPENCLEVYLQPVAVCISLFIKFDDCWAGTYCSFARAKYSKQIFACGLNNYKQLNVELKTNERSKSQNLCIRELTPWRGFISQPATREIFNAISPFVVSHISAGEHHSLVACTNGALFALGRHDYGRLGIGKDKKDAIVPELNPLFDGVNKKILKVATGPATTLAISTNYELYGWGMVTNNQLPIPGATEDLYEPHRVQINGQALDVSVGAQHALIIVKS